MCIFVIESTFVVIHVQYSHSYKENLGDFHCCLSSHSDAHENCHFMQSSVYQLQQEWRLLRTPLRKFENNLRLLVFLQIENEL